HARGAAGGGPRRAHPLLAVGLARPRGGAARRDTNPTLERPLAPRGPDRRRGPGQADEPEEADPEEARAAAQAAAAGSRRQRAPADPRLPGIVHAVSQVLPHPIEGRQMFGYGGGLHVVAQGPVAVGGRGRPPGAPPAPLP